jgi:DNA-binding transcriptional regulator GbsR (MarR family)
MNMHKQILKDNELWFVNEIASLLAPWGLPPSSGRIYGYLLLCQEPTSVDQMADALAMSRTGAWNSAKTLERFGHVTRYSVPGNKRGLYAASDNLASPFRAQTALFGNVGKLLQTCASKTAMGAAAERLEERARLWLAVHDATQKAIDAFTRQRDAQRATSTMRARKKSRR